MQNTTLCYIERVERGKHYMLLMHRTKKKHDMNANKWIGVGGHCMKSESPEACAIREIREETSLIVYPSDMRYCGIVIFTTDEGEGEYMHLFHITHFTGEVVQCDEGLLSWIPIEEMPSLPQWEGDKIFLRLMCSVHPFFSLKLSYTHETLRSAVLDGKPIPVEFGS